MTTTVLTVRATECAPAMLLRPWEAADLEALVNTYRDPLLRRFTMTNVESREDAERWLEIRRRGWKDGTYLSFAVLEKDETVDGRLVGNVVVKRPGPGPAAAEVGYWTCATARGRGVAPRALEAVTTWAVDAFTDDGLERLELLHQVDNPASCRVAEKCGYAFEATLPACPPYPLDGHLHIRRGSRHE